MYPEMIAQGGSEPGVFYRCPGLRPLAEVGTGPIRQVFNYASGKLLVVSGNELYKLSNAYSETLLGTLDTATGYVCVSRNNTQAMLTDGVSGYIYTAATDAFAKITDADFTGVDSNTYIASRFLGQRSGDQFQQSALDDGTDWDGLEFATAEYSPDNLVRIIESNKEAWLLGATTIEVWAPSSNADFAFEPIQGATISHGCMAMASVVQMDNTVIWLGRDQNGINIVYRANGYTPVRISTHALEDAFAGYEETSDAVAFAYQQRGHLFYFLTFPTGNATWVYDVATGLWHERAYLNPASGLLERHLASCGCKFNGEIVVGSRLDGNIYAFDLEVYDDDGDAQKWLRAWRALPTGQNNYKRTVQHSLQIIGQTGTGLISGQGSDPQVMMRFSDDGGQTWGNEHWTTQGAIGATGTRVFFRRLGSTEKLRDRVYEVSGTDPVKLAWTGAELHLSGAMS